MEYWLQLQVQAGHQEKDDDEESRVRNWLQDNNPLLSEIPQDQIHPHRKKNAVLHLSELKFGQNEQGYFVIDAGERIPIKSGDALVCQQVTFLVSITKLADTRQSVIPLDALSNSGGDQRCDQADVRDQTQGLGLLNSAFSPPAYHEAQHSAPVYDDMTSSIPQEESSSPLEQIEHMFFQEADQPFERQVPLHQQHSVATSVQPRGSVAKLKQLIWGE